MRLRSSASLLRPLLRSSKNMQFWILHSHISSLLLSASPRPGFCPAGCMALDRSAVCAITEPSSQGGAMPKRLKRTLVESYVGAIALGYLLAEVILYFAYIF